MLVFLCAFSSADQIQFSPLILGEWSGVLVRNGLRIPIPFSKFTVEFHPRPDSPVIEGSFWRDDVTSNQILPMDAFLLAHLEVSWDSGLGGQVFNLQPERSLLSKFEFRPFITGDAAHAKLTFPPHWFLDLTLYNGSYFTAVLSARETSGTAEYRVTHAQVPVVRPESRFGKWTVIGLIVVAVQIVIFFALRRYSASLTQRIDDVKAQVIIDLDGPAQPRGRARKRKTQ
jgi:hypothetical protein